MYAEGLTHAASVLCQRHWPPLEQPAWQSTMLAVHHIHSALTDGRHGNTVGDARDVKLQLLLSGSQQELQKPVTLTLHLPSMLSFASLLEASACVEDSGAAASLPSAFLGFKTLGDFFGFMPPAWRQQYNYGKHWMKHLEDIQALDSPPPSLSSFIKLCKVGPASTHCCHYSPATDHPPLLQLPRGTTTARLC